MPYQDDEHSTLAADSSGPERSTVLELLASRPARRANALPLYVQVAQAIEAVLASRRPDPVEPIPPERELAQALRVSRPTIRHALAYLSQMSVIYKRRGVGTFATPPAITRPSRLTSFHDDLVERGLQPTTRVLRLELVEAEKEIAADLHIEAGTPLVLIERVRSVEGRPVALHTNHIDLKGGEPPSPQDLEDTSLYELLRRRYGFELAMASQRVGARAATKREAALLGLASPACILYAQRISFDTAGRGIEHAINVYPAGTQVFEMHLTPSGA
jgi:Transcriptional regulators